jgi:cytochrome b6-f complex iron-sulfur subunit
MADPNQPAGGDDKAAKIAELQAKMAAAKAKRLEEAAGASAEAAPAEEVTAKAEAPVAAAAVPAETQPSAPATPAPAAVAEAEPPKSPPKPPAVSQPVGDGASADARIAAMRGRMAEMKARAGSAAAAARARTATKPDTDIGVWYLGRRDFMQAIGWMSFIGFLTIVIVGAVRAMFPRVIYERPPVFKAGFPNEYLPGIVNEKYKDEERVWIIRQNDGSFIAILAICTHLGCTPRWLTAENKFKCPCHGSGFRGTPSWGVNFEGPAPRPLERIAIHLAPDGQIEIDKSKKFLWEKQQWDDPASTLKA